MYDLLIAGGTLIDPGQGIHGVRDVAFRDGVVAAVEPVLARDDAADVIDATGRIVTPGLIDIHGHFFHRYTTIPGVADELCLPSGTTTAADAGTAGYATLGVLRDYVFPTQRTRLRSWLSIAGPGYLMSRLLDTEFHDMRVLDVDAAVAAIETNRDTVIGVKLRLGAGLQTEPEGREALDRALAAARAGGVPLMVHIFRSTVPIADLLARLAPGDVVTHAFHASPGGILDDAGMVLDEVRDAVAAGVILDAGYAGGLLCDHDVVRAALAAGITPATLGTDAVDHRVAPTRSFYGIDENVNLFSALGMGREDALAAVTVRSAQVLGLDGEVGSLRPGMAADAAIFTDQRGRFRWLGAGGQTVEADERLALDATILGGVVVWRAGDEHFTPAAEPIHGRGISPTA
jgi:dihydroorotase